jgi:peptidoglycan endopeptidase LytE
VTKRDWMKKSTVAVILSTSLLVGGQVGHAASDSTNLQKSQEIANIAESLVGKDYQYKAKGPSLEIWCFSLLRDQEPPVLWEFT